MPINGYSVGRDLTLTIVTGTGPLVLRGITSFKSRQDTTEEKITKINGVTDHNRHFIGWSGSFTLERENSTADDYFSQLESNYYQGIAETPVSITETIQEANGAVTQYRYTKVLLKLDDAGDWRGDTSVKISLSFVASRRLKIA